MCLHVFILCLTESFLLGVRPCVVACVRVSCLLVRSCLSACVCVLVCVFVYACACLFSHDELSFALGLVSSSLRVRICRFADWAPQATINDRIAAGSICDCVRLLIKRILIEGPHQCFIKMVID